MKRVRAANASKFGLAVVVAGAVLILSAGAMLPGGGRAAPAAYPGRTLRLPPMTSAMEQALENGAAGPRSVSSAVVGRSTIVVSRANGLTARVPALDPAFGSATAITTSASARTPSIVVKDASGLDRRVPKP